MDPKLPVLVQVDLEENRIKMGVTGRLTETSQRALHPLIRHARTLMPGIRVQPDLSEVQFTDPAGVDLLALDLGPPNFPAGHVTFLTPAPMPQSQYTIGPGNPARIPLRSGSARRLAA